MRIVEVEQEKNHVGARVNKHLSDLLKEAQIPISDVIESMLGYFWTLSEADKIRIIEEYNPENLNVEKIVFPVEANRVETLRALLMETADEDLLPLAQYQEIVEVYNRKNDKYSRVTLLIDELRRNGSSALADVMRRVMRSGRGIEYDEMVRDVARHLKVNFNEKSYPAVDYLEMEILKKASTEKLGTMSPERQREFHNNFGYSSGDIPYLNGPTLVSFLGALGSFLHGVAGFGSFAYDLAGAKFEKVIPCILHIAWLRQKYRLNKQPKCQCGAHLIPGNNFCGQCGIRILKNDSTV